MRKIRPSLWLILVFFLPSSILSAQGVVVETAAPASAPEKAGAREGDIFHAWTRLANPPIHPQPASGALESPFDWQWMEIEQAPRGTVELRGERQGEPLVIQVPIGLWETRVRPVLPAGLEDLYQRGKELVDKEQVEEGTSSWQRLAERAGESGSWRLQAWMWLRIALAWDRANGYQQAEAAYETALRESREPLSRIAVLDAMGASFEIQERFDEAEARYRSALELRELTWGETLQTARSKDCLGRMAMMRGDLVEAEDYCRRSLLLKSKLAPESLAVSDTLVCLGGVAFLQFDLDAGEEYLERSLHLRLRVAPGTRYVAQILSLLGMTAKERGALDSAERYFRKSLALYEQIMPHYPIVYVILTNLGDIAQERGDLTAAESYYYRSLIGKQSVANKLNLYPLGKLALQRGHLKAAESYLREFLVNANKSPIINWERAGALQTLAKVLRQTGRLQQAALYADLAVESLEAQIGKLGGTQEAKGRFRGRSGDIYRDALRLQLELGHPQEAFHLLERFRAQAFLALLAERDLNFAADLPPELDQERRRLAVSYDRNQLQLTALDPEKDGEAIEALQREQVQLRLRREEIAGEVRQTAPRLAALQDPRALTFEQVRAALDPGTVMLSYSVGKEQTHLFIVTPGRELQVQTLAVGRQALEKDVDRFRQLIDQTQAGPGLGGEGLAWFSRRLYRLLVEPAEPWIAAGDRIVLVPDGPLHLLPFAALMRKDGQYLVEWKPLSTVLSGTVFAELKKQRRDTVAGAEPSSRQWVAFGDPWFPPRLAGSRPADIEEIRLRSLSTRAQLPWKRLPQSRREVEEIAALFPADQRRTYLDREASEERAKAVGRDARILHFATHGYVDDRSPFDSALVLSIPEGLAEGNDNGLLQVWEIFESVRLDADLVVLSACETGLGEIRGGEGIIGLTRAFQYAGARSVLASLWRVEDEATAELMQRFYRHLRDGKTEDEALRAAQLDLIRRPLRVPDGRGGWTGRNAAAPYFWAALQLVGDGQ
ncbi:MAG: CHAT domain-containing protein [Acidobacteriota bacterium]